MALNDTYARQLISRHEQLGLTIPAPVKRARTALDKIRTGKVHVNVEAIGTATVNAILEDRDPTTDPDVVRTVISYMIDTHSAGMAEYAQAELLTAIRRSAPNFYTQWGKVVRTAGETLTRMRRVLGNINLDTATADTLNTPTDLDAFVQARTARDQIDTVLDAYRFLGQLTGHNIGKDRTALILSDPTLDEWEQHNLRRQNITVWDLVGYGLTIDLATPAEVRTRSEAHRTERDDREAARAKWALTH